MVSWRSRSTDKGKVRTKGGVVRASISAAMPLRLSTMSTLDDLDVLSSQAFRALSECDMDTYVEAIQNLLASLPLIPQADRPRARLIVELLSTATHAAVHHQQFLANASDALFASSKAAIHDESNRRAGGYDAYRQWFLQHLVHPVGVT